MKLIVRIKNFFKKDFRILFIQIYLIVLLIAFILALLFAAFPSLIACSSLFGEEFCTPTGLYLGLLASLPGYVVAGNLLSSFNEIPAVLSFIIVIATSSLFYFLLGLLIDKAKNKKFKKSEIIIISAFVTLLLYTILLLARLM